MFQPFSLKSMNLSPTPIACAIAALALGTSAHLHAQQPSAEQAGALPAVTVTGSAQPADGLPAPHAGGQVARGGSLGVLGNTDVMDAPFNFTSYTAELLENQQARSVTDAVANDPSVRASVSSGSFYENLTIRGFTLGTSELGFMGLYGLTPITRTSVEFAERVEVHKGPSAMLSGMPPGGAIGGSVSLVPKRAADEPLTRVGFGFDARSRAGVHVDLGRRFGPDNAVGVRINGVARGGEGAVRDQDRSTYLGSLALDWRGERLRLALDTYIQDEEQDGGTYGFTTTGVLPHRVPNTSRPTILGERAEMRDKMVLLSGEYDIAPNATAYAKYGWHNTHVLGVRTRITNLRADGGYNGAYAVQDTKGKFQSGEIGVRMDLTTGAVRHRVVVSATHFNHENFYGGFNAPAADFVGRNIYAPEALPAPRQWAGERRKSAHTRLQGIAVADTMAMLDDRLLLTLGLRRQRVAVDNFNAATGAVTTRYDEGATTPAIALVVRPTEHIALYANYIQGLTRGPTAPTGTGLINEGEVFPPYKSKQYEIGAKGEWDGLGGSVSLYQIARPSTLTRDNLFTIDGEQRNRGLEFNVYGEPTRGLRLLGGATFMNAKITKSTASIAGKRAFGIPRHQANLGVEWDPAFAPGLTLSARVLHTGSAYLNNANTVRIPSWTRWDAGVRYATRVAGKPVVLRANVENLLGKDYWMANDVENWLSISAPRTFMLSATVDF